MKKIVTTCLMGALFTSSLSADFARVELGGGMWQQTPKGYAKKEQMAMVFLTLMVNI